MIQPSLFDPPPSTYSPEWHELEWTNGRRYRWRLDTIRMYERPVEECTEAPGSWRWELEVDCEGEWREVRLYTRRDEIWAHVRERLV